MAKTALLEWYHNCKVASYKNLNELKADFPSISIIGDERVIFNIKGNQYRLIVRIIFDYKVIQIKWFGTHKDYDKTDVVKTRHKKIK